MAIIKKHFPLLLAVLTLLVLLPYLNRPLAGQHDWNSVYFGNAARNHLRYGLLVTKLGVATNVGYFPQETLGFYTHHPILMPLLLALSFLFFGITDWSVRLVPVLSAALLVYFLTRLTSQLFNRTTAIFASLFLIFSPMLRYYATIPIHETVVLGFLGLTFWAYFNWLNSQKSSYFYFTLLGLLLSQLTSWAGYYLSLYLPLHSLLLRKTNKKLLIILFLAPLMFLFHNLHAFWLTGGQAQSILINAFLFRLNLTPEAKIFGFNYLQFFTLQARWIVIYFTRIMTLLSSVWLIQFVRRRIRRQSLTISDSFIILFFIFGLTHNAIFRQQAFIHDYTLIYLLPFFTTASAVTLLRLYAFTRTQTRLTLLIPTILLILFATERLNYLKALYHSSDQNPGYYLGKTLNQLTPPPAKILLLNTELMRFYDVFLNYYADRRIIASDVLPLNTLLEFDYIVIPKSHDYVSVSDKTYLYTHFPHFVVDSGVIFSTRQL